MVIASSGIIRMSDIVAEHLGTPPHSLSEYYRGGGLVTNVSQNSNIPTVIGSPISFSDFYGTVRLFIYNITENVQEINFRTYLLTKGWDGTAPVQLSLAAGNYLWSNSTAVAAVTTGTFPGGLIFTNNGFIMGKGGAGGDSSSLNGLPGGDAISLSASCSIINNGYIGGGGGGGGSYVREYYAGGGGGAGGGDGGPDSRWPAVDVAGEGNGLGGAIGAFGNNGTGNELAYNGAGGSAGGGGGGYNQRNLGRDYPGGGGGGGRIFPGARTVARGEGAGYGGGSNEVGGNNTGRGAGGGGGWGAAGGSSSYAGGAGGRAIALNGFVATLGGNTTRIYGTVS